MFGNFIVGALGLIFGSFLNVAIYRIPRGESVVWPGSHCPVCGNNLKALDLIPVLSYLWLHGRCRYCQAKISHCYPLIELLTAVSFLMVYVKAGTLMATLAGWIFTSILIIVSFTDLNDGIIPDLITYPGIIIGLCLSPFTLGIKSAALGSVIFAGIFLGTAIISRGGMGGGDIKLAGVIGAFIGLTGSITTLIISSLAGGIWAASLLCQRKADRKTAVRFGPFMAVSAWLVWLYGEQILDFYMGLFI